MLGLRDKVKEQTGVQIFTVVTRYGCQYGGTPHKTGSTCWDLDTIYKSKLEYGCN